jgi:hypothetical protein
MEGISSRMSTTYSTPVQDFIIPEDYNSIDESPSSSVNWFQERLDLSDEYVAKVINVREELFSNWKNYHSGLTPSQIEKVKTFSITLTHLLSYLNFRHDLMMNILQNSSESPHHELTPLTPPWIGTSLKSYIESQGVSGLEEVDRWVQGLRWSDPF